MSSSLVLDFIYNCVMQYEPPMDKNTAIHKRGFNINLTLELVETSLLSFRNNPNPANRELRKLIVSLL